MSWNYRLVRYVANGETLFGLMEVYYDEKGQPNGYGSATVSDWETADDLRATILQMQRAFSEAVIDYQGDIIADRDEMAQ